MAAPADGQLVAAIKDRNLSLFHELLATPRVRQRAKWRHDDDVRLKHTYAAACHAAIVGETGFLRALCRGEHYREGCERWYVSSWAAKHGDLHCLRLALEIGLPWSHAAALLAAQNGHADCLEFALPLCGYTGDNVLHGAIQNGHLACVQLLVAHGLPREKPFRLTMDWRLHQSEPGMIPCLQHLFEQGCPMHPGMLIMAARAGRLDIVRFLHQRGVPLWTQACEADPYVDESHGPSFPQFTLDYHCLENSILPIPGGQGAAGMLDVLRWGHACGAPVTPAIEDLIRAKRAATRAVLLSFHGATRLRRGKGTRAQRGAWATWASMDAIPPVLVEEILVKANLEISETVGRSLPAPCTLECSSWQPGRGDRTSSVFCTSRGFRFGRRRARQTPMWMSHTGQVSRNLFSTATAWRMASSQFLQVKERPACLTSFYGARHVVPQ